MRSRDCGRRVCNEGECHAACSFRLRRDEIGDPQDLNMWLEVNGEQRQKVVAFR